MVHQCIFNLCNQPFSRCHSPYKYTSSMQPTCFSSFSVVNHSRVRYFHCCSLLVYIPKNLDSKERPSTNFPLNRTYFNGIKAFFLWVFLMLFFITYSHFQRFLFKRMTIYEFPLGCSTYWYLSIFLFCSLKFFQGFWIISQYVFG